MGFNRFPVLTAFKSSKLSHSQLTYILRISMYILHIWASNLRLHLKIIVDTFYTLGFLRIMWIHAPRNPRTLSMVSAQCLNFNVCHVPMFEAHTCVCAVCVCVQCVCAVCVCVLMLVFLTLKRLCALFIIIYLLCNFQHLLETSQSFCPGCLARNIRPHRTSNPVPLLGLRKGKQQQQQLLLLLLWQWHSGTVASRLGHSMAALATDVN